MKIFPLFAIAAIASGHFFVNPVRAQEQTKPEQIGQAEQVNLDGQADDSNADDVKQEEIEAVSQ